jgi:hypothetical protein
VARRPPIDSEARPQHEGIRLGLPLVAIGWLPPKRHVERLARGRRAIDGRRGAGTDDVALARDRPARVGAAAQKRCHDEPARGCVCSPSSQRPRAISERETAEGGKPRRRMSDAAHA